MLKIIIVNIKCDLFRVSAIWLSKWDSKWFFNLNVWQGKKKSNNIFLLLLSESYHKHIQRVDTYYEKIRDSNICVLASAPTGTG